MAVSGPPERTPPHPPCPPSSRRPALVSETSGSVLCGDSVGNREAFLLPQTAQGGRVGGGFHKNCSDPLLERKMECPSFSSGATWSEAFKLGNTTRSFMPFPPQFVFFKRGRTSFSHFVQPSELPQVQSCRQEQHQGWGGGAGRGGRWRVHSDKTRASCQSLLQQLLPLLFPQGLQVIRPLQGSLSENRVIFKRAVSHLSTITLLSYYS